MDQQTVIADIEERAYQAHVSIRALCARVGISPSTFARWKLSRRNSEPTGANLLTIGKICEALDQIEAERRDRVGRGSKAAAA